MLHKLLLVFLASLTFTASAQAASVTTSFSYLVNWADGSLAETGLSGGSVFSGSASYDDSLIDANNQVFIDGLGGAGTFSLAFGNLSFTEGSDLVGGPLLTLGPGNSLAGLLFDTQFTLTTGSYLLSFSGDSFQVTPSGNTADFKMQGVTPVPEPSTYAMLGAGLGLLGFAALRRKQKNGDKH